MKYMKQTATCLVACLLLLSACRSDERPAYEPQTDEVQELQPQGHLAELYLQGEYVEDGLRAFDLEEKSGVPQIKLEDNRTYDITLYVRRLGGSSVTTIPAKALYAIDQESGARRMSVKVESFRLQGANETFSKGANDWYICGVIGEAPRTITEQNQFSMAGRKLPLGFPWTPLTITQDGHGQQKALRFSLIGTLLRVGLRNNIVEPVEVLRLKLKSEHFAFAGSFAPAATTDDDLRSQRYLSFASTSSNQDFEFHVSEQAKLGNGTRILAGGEDMLSEGKVFVWGYPLKPQAPIEAQMEVVTRPLGFTAEQLPGSHLPASEKKSFQRYSVPSTLMSPKGGYQHGYVHKAPFLVTSDLMITEVYHCLKGNLSTSIIELHNPTLDPIELRHYGLMKVGEDKVGPVSTNWVAFFPQNDQTHSERGVDTGSTSGGYKQARTTQALILPLDLVTGDDADQSWAYWRWRTYQPLLKDGNDPNKTKYYTHTIRTRKLRTGVAKGDDLEDLPGGFLPMPTGTNPTLNPGKTMLILGPGYVEFTPDEQGYGLLYPTAAGGNGSGAFAEGQLGPGIQPIEACRQDYCQWAFAMANYTVGNASSFNDASATNFLAKDQGVVLVKQRRDLLNHPHLQNGMERKIIDCSHPWNNAGSSQQSVRDAYPKGSTNTYFRTRCDGDYFPSPNYKIDNWHFENMSWSNKERPKWKSREYYTGRATLGTRRFVQNGSKVNQTKWRTERYTAPTKSWVK